MAILDSIKTGFIDVASFPYNAATGRLTQLQKDNLAAQGQAEIQSVADSPGAQVNTETQIAAQVAANENSALLAGDLNSVSELQNTGPTACQHPLTLGGIDTSICFDGIYEYKWYFIIAGILLVLFVLAPYLNLIESRNLIQE